LLKWREQPQGRGPSWRGTIRHTRREIAKLLAESPSLHDYPARQMAAAYRHAREDAVFLQHAQQLCLQAEVKLTDLVEE
jgi:hypothetical protein